MASPSCIEVSLAECKWLASDPSLSATSSRASVASLASSSSESNLEIVDGVDSTTTEVALEQLRKWVTHKSRQLSMSKQDRQHFQEVTARYFEELNLTLKREAAADAESPAGEGDDQAVGSDAEEMSDGEDCGQGREAAEGQKDEEEEAGDREEEEQTASGSSGLYTFAGAWIFKEESEELRQLLSLITIYSNEEDDFFSNQNSVVLLMYLRSLLLYHLDLLQAEHWRQGRRDAAEKFRRVMRAYQQLFDCDPPAHILRQAQEALAAWDQDFSITSLSEQLQQVDSFNATFNMEEVLPACWLAFRRETEDSQQQQLAISLHWQGTCCICTADDQILMAHRCCDSLTCYDCHTKWVRTKVLARTVEVGCPSCGSHLTTPEILEFLGDSRHRYYEIITDMNGDPSRKTCPHCNLVTQAPAGRSRKRAGGKLVQCSRCEFTWCFRCHSQPHPSTSCRANSSGKHQLREWGAATYSDGSQQLRKARRCPSCKVWIEKNQGCNHMTCSSCNHEFCYICGKNWRGGNLVFGRHSSRLSIFGCKQKLLPKRPVLRKLIRGTLFVLETIGIVVGAPVLAGLLVALSPILGIIGIAALIYRCRQ